MKKMALVFGMLLLGMVFVSANGDHASEVEEGKQLVENGIDCDKLSDEQLETIGEYYMEQMHPGQSHEAMHEMMGIEEGTKYHGQVHVSMARMMYCSEDAMMGSGMMGSGGMMGIMPMMMNMMGSGMMGGQNQTQANTAQVPGSGMMQGMMGNNAFGFGMPFLNYGYFIVLNILYTLLLVGLVALVFLGVLKLWKDVNEKGAKK